MPCKPDVNFADNGLATILFTPTDTGEYDVNYLYEDASVEGCPMRIAVDAVDKTNFITVYGNGLIKGSKGQTLFFRIVTKKTLDDIDVVIMGPKGVANVEKKKAETGHEILCSYVAHTPGEYRINILHNEQHIRGSPFVAKVSGEGRKKSVLAIPAFSDYTLTGVSDLNLTNMVGQIKGPDGAVEQVMLKRMPDKKLGISSFQPKRKGVYVVEVMQEGGTEAAPFEIHISDQDACHPTKVKATGDISNAVCGTWNEIHLDLSDAGYGSISISVEGSHAFDMDSKTCDKGDTVIIRYQPHEPGIYIFNIKYGEGHIMGSPFMLSVSGDSSNKKREVASLKLKETEIAKAGSKYCMDIDLPGVNPLDITATLATPSGFIEACEIRDRAGSEFAVMFEPMENGLNVISLKQKGIHMTGSPFQYTVGSKPPGGTHKVEIFGVGVERAVVGSDNVFNIYTHEAGTGELSVGIDGPSRANIELVDKTSGFVTAHYTVDEPGEYSIGVRFNGEHILASPMKIKVPAECKQAQMVTVHGLRDSGLDVDKPAVFNVNNNSANGVFSGYIISPTGARQELFIQELDNEVSSCRFLPRDNGVFSVNVLFNDVHIPGSPFLMNVGKLGTDAALVRAKGDGLLKGQVDVASKFCLVTASAGLGIIGVTIEGPSKFVINCSETSDGYEFSYTPSAAGSYLVTLTYGYVPIPGSPFKILISGKGATPSDVTETSVLCIETTERKPKMKNFNGDASKIIISGTGLGPKVTTSRANIFTIDVKDAGQGLLIVSIISEKGNLCKDYSCKKTKPNFYTINYWLEDKGENHLQVTWGGKDVPGSPYTLHAL